MCTPGMKMKVLKLIFLVTNFIVRCFVVTFVITVMNVRSPILSTLWRSYIRVLKL